MKKVENWIFQKYGKWVSWISYMFDLIHSTKDSDKKNSKKVTCRHTFGLGRKMGRNGCRAWKWTKFKKFFSSAHGHYIASWLHTSKFLSDKPHSSTDMLHETAENSYLFNSFSLFGCETNRSNCEWLVFPKSRGIRENGLENPYFGISRYCRRNQKFFLIVQCTY